MGDGGLALAAAVAVAYRENGTRFPAPSMALGPDARSAAQNAELIASQYPQLAYSRPANLIETLVEALRENQVLGMFKGRMGSARAPCATAASSTIPAMPAPTTGSISAWNAPSSCHSPRSPR